MNLSLRDEEGNVIWQLQIIKDHKIQFDKEKYFKKLFSFMEILSKVIRLFSQRHIEYGDSWELKEFPNHEVMLTSLVCLTKTKRVCNMVNKNEGLKKYNQSIINNVLDIMVFCNFLLQQIDRKNMDS